MSRTRSRRASVAAAAVVVLAAVGAAEPAAGAAGTACGLITRAQAAKALGASASLSRGEDASLCNVMYGSPRRNIIMAFKPNVPGRLGYAAQRHAFRTHTEPDGLGGHGRFVRRPLAIAGAVGFEAEIFRKPADGPEEPDPDRTLILLRHHRILSLETTPPARNAASFAQLERLARVAIRRF